MGKIKENPRYNVISCRASKSERLEIAAVVGNGNLSLFLLDAAMEKVRREKQRRIDHALSERAL